jgi:hypothetical protein
MDPLLPQPGSSIDPRHAVGRSATTKRARRDLRANNNLALTDPRRMGKTVWIDLFCADPGDGLTAIKIDYEGVRTSEGFVLRTVQALAPHRGLPGKTLEKLRGMFEVDVAVTAGPVRIKAGVASRSPATLLEETFTSVNDHVPANALIVIAMDEVPMALANISAEESPTAAGTLLQTMRELRRRQGSNLRWIVSGSVGFHHILRKCDATEGAINDLVNLPLGPLPASEATELAERLLLGIERAPEPGTVDALVEVTDGIPYLIHALTHWLADAGTGAVSPDDVVGAFDAFVELRDESRAVTHLLTRLDPLYGETTPVAETILDTVALAGEVDASMFAHERAVLVNLVDDHYLAEHDARLSWRYEALRRIWSQRRGLK